MELLLLNTRATGPGRLQRSLEVILRTAARYSSTSTPSSRRGTMRQARLKHHRAFCRCWMLLAVFIAATIYAIHHDCERRIKRLKKASGRKSGSANERAATAQRELPRPNSLRSRRVASRLPSSRHRADASTRLPRRRRRDTCMVIQVRAGGRAKACRGGDALFDPSSEIRPRRGFLTETTSESEPREIGQHREIARALPSLTLGRN